MAIRAFRWPNFPTDHPEPPTARVPFRYVCRMLDLWRSEMRVSLRTSMERFRIRSTKGTACTWSTGHLRHGHASDACILDIRLRVRSLPPLYSLAIMI